MNSATPVQFAAVGIVLMQASVAVTLLGTSLRVAFLAAGMALICVGAVRSSASLPQAIAIQLLALLVSGALAFEFLSWFNAHLVFEPKLVVFRWFCWALFAAGVLLGLGNEQPVQRPQDYTHTTFIAGLIVASGLGAWFSVESIIQTEGVRGSFDESSPVALGFTSGTLAIAALAAGLRSQRMVDYALGQAGFVVWALVGLRSGSRGALLSLGLTALGIMVASSTFTPRRVLLFAAIACLALAERAAFDSALLKQISYVLERFEAVFTFDVDPSIGGRRDSRADLLEHNLNLPGILTLGAEGFDAEIYPHNFEVEAIVRLGAPIALLFVFCIAYLIWRMLLALCSRACDSATAIIFSMGVFTFFNAQTNLMWEFLRPLWLAAGLALGVAMRGKTRQVQWGYTPSPARRPKSFSDNT